MENMNRILSNLLAPLLVTLLLVKCSQSDRFYQNAMKADVYNQLYDIQSYDFLWVLDNSGSMRDRTAYVRDNIGNFIKILTTIKAVDFQMSVVTVDFFDNGGNLVQSPAGLNVVKSATSANPAADFASIVNAVSDSPTSFWEQGLEAAFQAISKNGNVFSRPGIPLIIIFVTDADDYSCAENCYGNEAEHNSDWKPYALDRYVSYFKSVKSAENMRVDIFPIVGIKDSTCQFEDFGSRYISVMNELGTNGVLGSVCSNDIKAAYEGVAKTLADRGRFFKLTSASKGQGISVYIDGKLIPPSPNNYVYNIESNSIEFTGVIPTKGSKIEVTYNQKGK